MALEIGPGLDAWCKAHQATPLESETYPWPDVPVSVLPIDIGNAQGQAVRTVVAYDKATNTILTPGPGVVLVPKPAPPAPPTTMYDSTAAADIPANAQAAAGYVDGLYRWSAADFARFPVYKRITIDPTTGKMGGIYADGLDVENGDATPEQAAQWLRDWQAGLTPSDVPILYFNVDTKPAVDAACAGLTFLWWAADWTGEPHLVDGSAATQYADPTTSGGHYDLSVLGPTWPA